MLAKRRLEQESELLQQTSTASGSQADMVTAENLPTSAVGPTLLLELQIEGVKVNALVDSLSPQSFLVRGYKTLGSIFIAKGDHRRNWRSHRLGYMARMVKEAIVP